MNEQEFLALLRRTEGKTLDFKATHYDFYNDWKRSDFVKDVLAMANTPREEPSYIILGVKNHSNGTCDLLGLDRHIDEAELQDKFDGIVAPIPEFSYEIIHHNGKQFGVITIPVQKTGPFLPIKDFPRGIKSPNLNVHYLYFRRGSKNTVAYAREHNDIYQWFAGSPENLSQNLENGDEWESFIEAVHGFESTRRYILLSSSLRAGEGAELSGIGRWPWSLVCDFDPDSTSDGLHNVTASEIADQRRSLHNVVLGDRLNPNPERATYWFFARGLAGRQSTIATGPWKEWTSRYNKEINSQFESFAGAISPVPVTCVVMWYDVDLILHLDSTLQAAQVAFAESIEFVIVTKHRAEVEWLAVKYEAKAFNIPLHQLSSGLKNLNSDVGTKKQDAFMLPSSSGAPVSLSLQDQNWLSEDLDIVHLKAGTAPMQDHRSSHEFLQGAEIDWYELSTHYDVDRDKTNKLRQRIENELKNKPAVRINLYHAPGAGGTTVARRILWEMHLRYPCAILQRCQAVETVEKLRVLHTFTDQPILLLVDGSQVVEREIDDLFSVLRSRQIPVVLFQVLRRFHNQSESQRVFYLPMKLNEAEAWRFVEAFSRATPHKRENLENLVNSGNNSSLTAFHFGLEAFGEDFKGLESYVEARLLNLTEVQRKIVCFFAIAHRYAQRPLRAQAFVNLLGVPKNRSVDLNKILPPETLELLTETQNGTWRTAHDLIAQEVLRQIVTPKDADRRTWHYYLSTWAVNFAEFCRGDSAIYSQEMLELARRVFIYRDNSEILGTERTAGRTYAQLIEDIRLREGQLHVLKEITKLFDQEGHFHAHLGRFYAYEMEDFARALECCEHAISLQEIDDHVLHHIKGMILRQQIIKLTQKRDNLDGSELTVAQVANALSERIEQLVMLAKHASASFEQVRKINPENEHGYISEVQMLISLLDYIGRKETNGLLKYLAMPTTDTYLRESLERAEDLLEHVRRAREGEGENTFEEECRARLNAIYGRHDEALQTWNSLLGLRNTFQPPIRRQIVWTYLARRGRSWLNLEPREVDRIISLLEENLQEEPTIDKNLRLWVQAIRVAQRPPALEVIIERVALWKATAATLEAAYYLYVFYTLFSLEGSAVAREEAIRFRDECSQMARLRRNRTRSFEWLGQGIEHSVGIKNLVHYSSLGEWDKDIDFWQQPEFLGRVRGRISHIGGPQQGTIELQKNGMTAFFVPVRTNHSKGDLLP